MMEDKMDKPTEAPPPPTATPEPPPPTATPEPAPTEPPMMMEGEYGGTLTFPLLFDAGDLNPKLSGYFFNYSFGANVYSSIVRYNWEPPRDKVIGSLAESWDINADATQYTFNFREGITWHDGEPFHASDAAFSLKQNAGRFAAQLEKVSSYETPDATTLILNLSRPSSSVPSLLAHMRFPVFAERLFPADEESFTAEISIGTGPYVLAEIDRDVEYVLERNPNYFIPELPFLDSIRAVVQGDHATRLALFRGGQLDVLGPSATMVDIETADDVVASVDGAVATGHPSLDQIVVVVNSAKPPWDNLQLRQALFLSFNRWEMAEGLPFISKPSGPLVGPPGWGLSDDELNFVPGYKRGDGYEADLEMARGLLAQAGYPDGLETEVIGSQTAALETSLEVIVDHMSRIGITASPSSGGVPSADDVKRRSEGDFELNVQSVTLSFPDPDGADQAVIPGLFTKLEDAEIQRLFEAQGAESDPGVRADLVRQLQIRMLETVSIIPIGWQELFWLTQGNVHNLYPPMAWSDANFDHVWKDA